VNVGIFDAAGVFHPAELTSLSGVLTYLSGSQFDNLIFAHVPHGFGAEVYTFLQWLTAAFLGVGLPLGLWGIWELWQRERAVTLGLLLILGLHAFFFISYGAFDKATMLLPVYLIWAIFLGASVQTLHRDISPRVAYLTLLLPVALLLVNAPFATMHDAWGPAREARQRLAHAEPDALYLAQWGDADMMRYYQIVDGIRPDIAVVNAFFIPEGSQSVLIATALHQQRPVYTTFTDEALNTFVRFTTVSHGFRLTPRQEPPWLLKPDPAYKERT
jgi:hypothetical protein